MLGVSHSKHFVIERVVSESLRQYVGACDVGKWLSGNMLYLYASVTSQIFSFDC